MNRTNTILRVGCLAVALQLAACASVPLADVSLDAKAKEFATSPEASQLYIYRDEHFGGAIKMSVFLDNQSIGQTGPCTYLMKSITPGEHTVMGKAENESSVSIFAQPGTNYFVRQEVKLGVISARNKLATVEPDAAKAAISQCKLVQTL